MEIIIDNIQKTLIIKAYTGEKIVPFYSKEAFAIILKHWLKVGWTQKYVYTFSCMGGRLLIIGPEHI